MSGGIGQLAAQADWGLRDLGKVIGSSPVAQQEARAKFQAEQDKAGLFQALMSTTPDPQIQGALINNFMRNNPGADLNDILKMQSAGYTIQGQQEDIATKKAESARIARFKKQVAAQFPDINLDQSTEDLSKEYQARIIEERTVGSNIKKNKSIASKVYNVNPSMLSEDTLSMDTPEFISMLKDKRDTSKAKTKEFMTPQGDRKILAVNDFGEVRFNNQWVPIENLDLVEAPEKTEVTNIDASEQNELAKELGKVKAKDIAGSYTTAGQALSTIEASYSQQDALERGEIITGTFAEQELALKKTWELLGIASEDDIKQAGGTEAFLAQRAKRVGQEITLFGAGTGLSDKDREFAQKMVGGDITLSKESIRKILYLERHLAAAKTTAHNREIDRSIKDKNLRDSYKVEEITLDYTDPANIDMVLVGDKEMPVTLTTEKGTYFRDPVGKWRNATGDVATRAQNRLLDSTFDALIK